MKYVPPFGANDPNASYINGDPVAGVQGSIAGAAVFENPQREIVGVIAKSEMQPTDADLLQLAKAVRSHRMNYAEDTGTENNISCSFDPPLGAYTVGLQLHVRVRHTNSGPVRFNGGAGHVPVRKLNGAEVGAEEIPAGAVITLTFDGTAFQLSNYGGLGGGDEEIFNVKVPFVQDSSPWRDVIIANFIPEIDQVAAGDLVAVRIAHTNYGPTTMYVCNLPGAPLKPNGGATVTSPMMLQGDIQAGDIILFCFDGVNWCFTPNPEINSWVMYTVGNGQQFTTVEHCIDTIRRKTIGANGYVHIQCAAQIFYAPANRRGAVCHIQHAFADRIAVVGTMRGPNPEWNNFSASSATEGGRYQDSMFNLNMLRSRYGTIFKLPYNAYPNSTVGIANTGPGTPSIHNIMIEGNMREVWPQGWAETGVACWNSTSINMYNVAIWCTGMGIWCDSGAMHLHQCWIMGCTHHGCVSNSSCSTWVYRSGIWGCREHGMIACQCSYTWNYHCWTAYNGYFGVSAATDSCHDTWYLRSWGNLWYDCHASVNSVVNICWPYHHGTTSPALNTEGNWGGICIFHQGIEFAPPPL